MGRDPQFAGLGRAALPPRDRAWPEPGAGRAKGAAQILPTSLRLDDRPDVAASLQYARHFSLGIARHHRGCCYCRENRRLGTIHPETESKRSLKTLSKTSTSATVFYPDVTNGNVPRMHILHGNTREYKTEMIKCEARYSMMASFAQPRNTSWQVGSLRNSEIGTRVFESCGRLILFVRFFCNRAVQA